MLIIGLAARNCICHVIVSLAINLFSITFEIIQSPHLQTIKKDNFRFCLGEGQEKLEQSSLLLS